jgi:hypothetical protein
MDGWTDGWMDGWFSFFLFKNLLALLSMMKFGKKKNGNVKERNNILGMSD